jgi:hypothetical protein
MVKRANGNGVGHNSGRLWLQRAYNSVDHDPEIDRFQKLWQRENLGETDLAVLAGVGSATVRNMFGGKTRRPQHTTFAKIGAAMGYRYKLERAEAPDYEAEIPKARAEFKAYRETLAKKKPRRRKK